MNAPAIGIWEKKKEGGKEKESNGTRARERQKESKKKKKLDKGDV